MEKLSGKTALVTGASRGIGRASALALAACGAQVLVHYGRGAAEANAVVAEINNAGGRADAITADLSASDGPHKLAQQVRSIIGDRLDILVANAGVSKAATIEETSVDDFDRLFAVNVRAPFFLVQQLLPIMHEGSSVVFVSSLAAHAVVGILPAYAATKCAIETLVKHLAAALGQHGIRVNAIAPGVVATEMSSFTKTDVGRDYVLGLQTSWPRATLAGLPATASMSTAARSFDRDAMCRADPAHPAVFSRSCDLQQLTADVSLANRRIVNENHAR
jgi:NAD(P)-dependent dehydrogenase (short-subunit alcohol dehydrogenase family)